MASCAMQVARVSRGDSERWSVWSGTPYPGIPTSTCTHARSCCDMHSQWGGLEKHDRRSTRKEAEGPKSTHLHALQPVHARDTISHRQHSAQVRDGGLILLLELLDCGDQLGAHMLDQVLAAELGLQGLSCELACPEGDGRDGPAAQQRQSVYLGDPMKVGLFDAGPGRGGIHCACCYTPPPLTSATARKLPCTSKAAGRHDTSCNSSLTCSARPQQQQGHGHLHRKRWVHPGEHWLCAASAHQ